MQKCAENPKELILSATKQLVRSQGLESINMRTVATRCGISVGTVYNSYPTKNDLLMAVVEDFWEEALADFERRRAQGVSLSDGINSLYQGLADSLTQFSAGWLGQLSRLQGGDMAQARQKEQAFFLRVRAELERLLDNANLPPQVWSGCFTKGKLAEVLFGAMLSMLRRGETDTSFLLEALGRMLYLNEI